jgi:hypothetical protein
LDDLKVQMRRHRFPGVTLERAIEAAIKGRHYEAVMQSIVAGTPSAHEPRDA